MKNYLVERPEESMWIDVTTTNQYRLCQESVDVGLDALKGKEFISALKNKALVGTLRDNGINAVVNPIYVKMQPEDELYSVSPLGNVKILEYREDEKLPNHISFRVTHYTLRKV